MSDTSSLDALVAELRADVSSGATEVARGAARILRRAALELPANSAPELNAELGRTAVAILDAQPAMASLVALACAVLSAGRPEAGLDEVRHRAAAAAEDFAAEIEVRADALAHRVAEILPAGRPVLTLSASEAAARSLITFARRARGATVICLESRPVREGRTVAVRLAGAGISVVYAVDAAVGTLVRGCGAILFGADSIGDHGVVNKVGSLAAALAGRHHGVPVYVAADTTKILPEGIPQVVEEDRPAHEVWNAPDGVSVWNRYFEAVPLGLVTLVITERGPLSPTDLAAFRAGLTLPPPIRAWRSSRP